MERRQNISVSVVSDGTMYRDGGSVFGPVPRSQWAESAKPNRQNKVVESLNCLLIQHPECNILVNTGIGTKNHNEIYEFYNHRTSKLMSNLAREGVKPADIDIVVLTNLHFNRAGGATKINSQNKLIPTFKNAEYIVQKAAWDDAQELSPRAKLAYGPGVEDAEVLDDAGQLKFVDGHYDIAPHVKMVVVDGFAPGHSIILVEAGSKKYMYLSDMVPTQLHIYGPCITAYDRNPDKTYQDKLHWINKAKREGWVMVFAGGHGVGAAGYYNANKYVPVTV